MCWSSESWLSNTIGTEVSVFTGFDFNTTNDTAAYKSGDIFHVDAVVAQHLPLLGGIAGAGISGFYRKQISGDSGSGARLGSFKSESYGYGPTISYVREFENSALIVDASWLTQSQAENTVEGDYLWLKITIAWPEHAKP